MSTIEITKDNINETIEKSEIVFLDFWASWCGPCRMFGPIFEKAAENHPDIVFGKVKALDMDQIKLQIKEAETKRKAAGHAQR